MDPHETADRSAERPDGQPGRVVTPGISFEIDTDATGALEVAADVTGTRFQVEVQRLERRVQVIFGSLYGSCLIVRMSDPAEIAEVTSQLSEARTRLVGELAKPGADDA